jgi:hypothetical protein
MSSPLDPQRINNAVHRRGRIEVAPAVREVRIASETTVGDPAPARLWSAAEDDPRNPAGPPETAARLIAGESRRTR